MLDFEVASGNEMLQPFRFSSVSVSVFSPSLFFFFVNAAVRIALENLFIINRLQQLALENEL